MLFARQQGAGSHGRHTFDVRRGEGGERGNFRYCGKEVRQDDGFGVNVTTQDNRERTRPCSYDVKRKLNSRCSEEETSQLRSATQALAWIARQVRCDLSYGVSKLQAALGHGAVKDLRECN